MSMRKNRNTLEIVAHMLEAAAKECKKTHIMYKSNLSYVLLKKYLDLVMSNGLLTYDTITQTYRTTHKGLTYIREYAETRRSFNMFHEKKLACESLLRAVARSEQFDSSEMSRDNCLLFNSS